MRNAVSRGREAEIVSGETANHLKWVSQLIQYLKCIDNFDCFQDCPLKHVYKKTLILMIISSFQNHTVHSALWRRYYWSVQLTCLVFDLWSLASALSLLISGSVDLTRSMLSLARGQYNSLDDRVVRQTRAQNFTQVCVKYLLSFFTAVPVFNVDPSFESYLA